MTMYNDIKCKNSLTIRMRITYKTYSILNTALLYNTRVAVNNCMDLISHYSYMINMYYSQWTSKLTRGQWYWMFNIVYRYIQLKARVFHAGDVGF